MNLTHQVAQDNFRVKPKLVLFAFRYDEHLPDFMLLHHREHIQCLSESFDVTVVRDSCDYQQVCDKYQPDLSVFESGLNTLTCRRPEITNVQACPEIPRVGFINADAWCETRSGTLSEMDHWRVETLFSISVTAAEHAPEIADRLFIWPNFVDPQLHKDYGESKLIPILLTGATGPQYPWRRRVYKLISEYYPSLSCPHGGYLSRSGAGQVLHGEQYARTINASLIVPTCGTIAKEVVRKHFEIPACKACLVTEKSPGLEAAGFVDMTNCVFADEHDILDKLAYLFEHPDKLQAITEAGHQLVHSRHTLRHRDQLLQWLTLSKTLSGNQQIVQRNPFEPLSVLEKAPGIGNVHVVANGQHLALLREGDDRLMAGKYAEAEVLYLKCLNHMKRLPEAKLRLAICRLFMGDARKANEWAFEPIQYSLDEYGAIDPDPVEWCYYIISLVCLGRLTEASERVSQYPDLTHPDLERARWVVNVLNRRGSAELLGARSDRGHRSSIHRLPVRLADEWVTQVGTMLAACGQQKWAEALTTQQKLETQAPQIEKTSRPDGQQAAVVGKSIFEIGRNRPQGALWNRAAERSFEKRLLLYKVHRKRKAIVSAVLRNLEARWGYRVPYAVSKRRNDEFFRSIEELTREEDIRTALVVGAGVCDGGAEAVLMGARENKNAPSVFCICNSAQQLRRFERNIATWPSVKCYGMSSQPDPNHLTEEFRDTVNKIKLDHGVDRFDIVLVDGSEVGQLHLNGVLTEELYAARVVLLDGINSPANYENYSRLCQHSEHRLVDHNPGWRNGYAIFKKADSLA